MQRWHFSVQVGHDIQSLEDAFSRFPAGGGSSLLCLSPLTLQGTMLDSNQAQGTHGILVILFGLW